MTILLQPLCQFGALLAKNVKLANRSRARTAVETVMPVVLVGVLVGIYAIITQVQEGFSPVAKIKPLAAVMPPGSAVFVDATCNGTGRPLPPIATLRRFFTDPASQLVTDVNLSSSSACGSFF